MADPVDENESNEIGRMACLLPSPALILSHSGSSNGPKTTFQPSVISFFKPINKEEFHFQLQRDLEKQITPDGQLSIASTKEEKHKKLR